MELLLEKEIISPEADIFKMEKYTKSFVDIIKKTGTPYTISIQGEWGSGKTSFVNLVFDKLKKEAGEKFETCVLNTWDYAQLNDESITESILKELICIVSKTPENRSKLFEIFDAFISKSTSGAIMNQLLQNKTNVNLKELWRRKSDKTIIEDEYLSPKMRIEKFKELLSKEIGNEKHVIFIDDLDRISPDKVIDVLEAIKVFLQIPNCIFILAVDYDVVVEGFKGKMGSSMTEMKSRNFFDKIIQLPFILPKPEDETMEKFIKEIMTAIDFESEILLDLDDLTPILLETLDYNPRKIKRVLNSYWLGDLIRGNDPEKKPLTREEIRAIIYFTCMQVEMNSLFEFVKKNSQRRENDEDILAKYISDRYLKESYD